MSLRDLIRAHREGTIPRRAIALTFDDGYADNLHRAKPLLERYEIPATVFVATGYLGQNREFWWDELERLLLQPGQLPERLCLTVAGNACEWKLGRAVCYSEEQCRSDRACRPWDAESGSRLFFFYSVWQHLRPRPHEERRELLDAIATWANSTSTVRPDYLSLRPEDLPVLAEGGLVDVGAHTVTHPALSAHTVAYQQAEIQKSKAFLEEYLGHPLTSFAYPFGDRASETVELVRQSGFDCACSTVSEAVWKGSDPFQLPRVEVRNWDGERFGKQLSKWFREG